MFDDNTSGQPQDNSATTTPAYLPATNDQPANPYADNTSAMPEPSFAPAPPADVTPVVSSDNDDEAKALDTLASADAVEPKPVDDVLPASGSVQAGSDDLMAIKQKALQQLSPLVGHLEQTPEEKFKTTMMMIQASDNKDLIDTAYQAAQEIPDEKVRAQALLDIVNEINYFTQNAS